MSTIRADARFKGKLETRVIKKEKVMKHKTFGLPFGLGRLMWLKGPGEAVLPGNMIFATHLEAKIFANGILKEVIDLGDGVVTQAGVNIMAADWANNNPALKVFNYHQSGTGTTAPAIGDTTLQTAVADAGSIVAGAPSNTTSPAVYKTIATLAYTAVHAITEWGLFNALTGSCTASLSVTRT